MARCRAQLKKALAQLQLKTEEGMTLRAARGHLGRAKRNIELFVLGAESDAAKQALVRVHV